MEYMNNINDSRFSNRSELGKWGEELCKEFFTLKGFEFEDVTENHDYQIIDVDFVVNISGKNENVETKTLKNRIANYNSLMIKYYTEYIDEDMKQKKGNDAWLEKCQAKYIIFCCRTSKKIIIVNFSQLKKYIKKYKDTPYIRTQKFFDEDKEHGGKYNRYNHVYYISIPHLQKTLNIGNREYVKTYTDLM